MFGFPRTTKFNKKIPKQKFYENQTASTAWKRVFTEQIDTIYWCHKLAASTLNLALGQAVAEIEVIELRLRQPQLNESVLRKIDKDIPYHTLFILSFEEKCQAWIGYKDAAISGTQCYYSTPWYRKDEWTWNIIGLNMDVVYENLVRQIAGPSLQTNPDESLKEAIRRNEQQQNLQKQIIAMETKIQREKQLNRQVEMNTELKNLKKELRKLGNQTNE